MKNLNLDYIRNEYMNFTISATTDIGIKKSVNQDSLFVRKISTQTGTMVFAVLCDGMGGLKKGEVASASLVKAFSEWMYTVLSPLSQRLLEDHIIKEQWISIITSQNEKIRAYSKQEDCLVGSTITALLITEPRYFLLNIGDTRAYEISEGLKQLTVDHTVIADEIERRNITLEQAKNAPIRNVLTKCVGVSETVYPDMFFGETKKNVVYMLCSDGFRHHITADEIAKYLYSGNDVDDTEMKRMEGYLVDLNKQRGETDNISVITIATGK